MISILDLSTTLVGDVYMTQILYVCENNIVITLDESHKCTAGYACQRAFTSLRAKMTPRTPIFKSYSAVNFRLEVVEKIRDKLVKRTSEPNPDPVWFSDVFGHRGEAKHEEMKQWSNEKLEEQKESLMEWLQNDESEEDEND